MASPRTTVPARGRRLRMAVVLAVAALGAVLVPGSAAAAPTTAGQAAELVAARGHDLEVTTERFNEAREALLARQAAAQAAADQVAAAEQVLAEAREQVRGVARSAFTGDSMGSFQALMTSDSAEEFVDRVGLLSSVAGHQGELMARAVSAGEVAAQAQASAAQAAAEARVQFEAVAAQQAALQAEIGSYQADFARLTADERRAALELAAAHVEGGERTSRDESTEPAAEPAPVTAPASAVVADSDAARTAVDVAMAQRGKPYVWAAAGPRSFDCSGLTQYAFRAAGISLPHSSRMQAQMGQPVSRGDLRPGDLVFFYRPVSHVGIYIGNGQMVHAPTSGDVVKVTAIDSMGGYSGARRISA